MKKFDVDLVIFDMDGTILDTLEDLKDALNHALSVHGYEERSLDEVRRFVGNGIRRLIERALPDGAKEETIDNVFQTFMPYYQIHCKDKTKPYTGITELIRSLKQSGYRTAVVSNKADAAVKELCREYFDGLFDYAVGEKEGIKRKPAPDSVLSAMHALHAQKAVYIGDSEVDIETAQNAGLDCIMVTWGFREKAFLAAQGARYFADKTDDILQLISNHVTA